MRSTSSPILLGIVVASAACASSATTQPGPRGLRADDHLEAAREHAEAAERLRWSGPPPVADGSMASSPEVSRMSWFYYWDPRIEHERLAEIHRAKASEIEAEYELACGAAPGAEVRVSPIVRYGIGGSPVENGAALYLSTDAGTPEHVLEMMRCHRAWMMLGRTLMDDCPLDLDGIEVVAHAVPGAIEVLLTVKDPTKVHELQRRAAKDVEQASGLRVHGETH